MNMKRYLALALSLLMVLLTSFAALSEEAQDDAAQTVAEETAEETADEAQADETADDSENEADEEAGADAPATLEEALARIAELEAEVALYKPWYDAQVVIEFDGGTIFLEEVEAEYQSLRTYYQQSSGIDIEAYGMGPQYRQMIADNLLTEAVKKAKAAQLGIDLSEETLTALQTEADAAFETYIASVSGSVASEGMSDEEVREAAIAFLNGYGYSAEAILDSLVQSERDNAITQYIIADVTITEDEVRAQYDADLQDQQERFEDDAAYVRARTGDERILWNPEGYRAVKQVLIKFDDDQSARYSDITGRIAALQAELEAALAPAVEPDKAAADETDATDDETANEAEADATDDETADEAEADATDDETANEAEANTTNNETANETEADATDDETADEAEADATDEESAESEPARDPADIQADLDAANDELEALYAELMVTADEVRAKFDEGAEFTDLIAAYNEDPGMMNEPTASDGYAVCEGCSYWDPAFTEAAMSIPEVGGISEPGRGSYGLYIVYYDHDIEPGAVPFEDVHDVIAEKALEDKRDTVYDETLDAWVEEMNPVRHYDRLA